MTVERLVLQPGWRSSDLEDMPGGRTWREAPHFLYHAAGRVRFVEVDGHEFEAGPGQVVWLPNGCEAYVVGEDPVLIVDLRLAIEGPP